MRMVKLPLAACILVASGIAGPAVEMTKPFEALEQSRRAMIELDKRQRRAEVERLKQEREEEAKRKREGAEQRKRERADKAQQETQRKSVSAAEKATEAARPTPMMVPPAPGVADKRNPRPSPEPHRQGADRQPPVQKAPPAEPQAGTPPPTAQPLTPPATSGVDERRPPARPEPGKPTLGVAKGQEESKEPAKSAGQTSPNQSPGPHHAAAGAAAGGHSIAVSRLKRMNLYNDRGEKLGDVERVLQSSDGNFHIIIGVGFRIRDRDVRIPLEQVTMRNNRLIAQGLTDEQVKIMPVFDGKDRTYRDVAHNPVVPMFRDYSTD